MSTWSLNVLSMQITARRFRCSLRYRYMFMLCLGLALQTVAHAAEASKDPLEGKWWGTTGSEKERIEVGFEFRRDDTGTLRMRFTQPISNVFDYADTSEIVRDGNRVEIEGFALSLTLKGDELTGTYPGPKGMARLKRVNDIPQESPPPDLPEGADARWQTRIGGQVYATPAIAEGVAFIGGTGGVLNAVGTDKGEVKWTFPAGAPILGEAAVSGDAVYFVSDNGFLTRLERSSGKQVWRYELGDAGIPRILPHPTVYNWDMQAAAPVVSDGVVFVGSRNGDMHAVDAATGERKWRFATRGAITNAAAIEGDRVVVGSADHHIYALDRNSGRELWRFDTKAPVNASPLVHEGRVYIGNRGPGLYALEAESGKEIWRLYFWGSWVESTPVMADGVLYIGSSDLRRVSAINPDNGHVLWRSDVYGWTWGTPLVVGDRIVAAAAGGAPYFVKHVASLNILDRKTGQLLVRRSLPEASAYQWGIAGSAVRSGDNIIVATIEGSLFAYPMP